MTYPLLKRVEQTRYALVWCVPLMFDCATFSRSSHTIIVFYYERNFNIFVAFSVPLLSTYNLLTYKLLLIKIHNKFTGFRDVFAEMTQIK